MSVLSTLRCDWSHKYLKFLTQVLEKSLLNELQIIFIQNIKERYDVVKGIGTTTVDYFIFFADLTIRWIIEKMI